MSDEKRYTERDMVLAKREGYLARAHDGYSHSPCHCEHDAKRRFPLPRVTRPRVVKLGSGISYRLDARGRLCLDCDGGPSSINRVSLDEAEDFVYLTAADLDTLADLKRRPTEEVSEDEAHV